jgi:hypothetical protein
MSASDRDKPASGSLTDRITELESLLPENTNRPPTVPVLKDTPGGDHPDQAEIPVLDELVHAEDVDSDDWARAELPPGTADQMVQLIDKIEHRLTDELEALVQTLKSAMRESILDELKTRLESSAKSPAGDKPD